MNRKFKDVLEECINAVVDNGQSVAECLARYPQQATELEPLIRLAVAVREASRREAPAHLRDRLQQRLLTEVTPRKMPRRSLLFGLPRWATAAAAVLLVAIVAGGTLTTSASSLPGDVLYPVKTAAEGVRLTLARDPDAVADLHLEFAQRRLEETRALAEAQRPIPPAVLDNIMKETQRAEELFLGPSRGGPTPSDAAKARLAMNLAKLTARQQAVLSQVMDQVPPHAQSPIQRIIGFSQGGYGRALAVINTGTAGEETEIMPAPASLLRPEDAEKAQPRSAEAGQTPKPPLPPAFLSPPAAPMKPKEAIAERPAVTDELTRQFGVDMAQIRQWRQSGLSYGDIFRILQWSQLSGRPAEEIVAMHMRGRGWGHLRQELGLKSAPLLAGEAEDEAENPPPATPQLRKESGNEPNDNPAAPETRTPIPPQEHKSSPPPATPGGKR